MIVPSFTCAPFFNINVSMMVKLAKKHGEPHFAESLSYPRYNKL